MEFRILVSDSLHKEGIDVLSAPPNFHVDVKTGLAHDALKDILGDYHALVVRSATTVTADLLNAARELKVVGRAGTGVDNIDVAEATRRGIVVMNTPGGNAEATAEHTIAMITAAHRHIPQAVTSMKMGQWEKKKFQGREMTGRTLGVIGLGQIGSIVCKRARYGLKMNVLGYDPATTPEAAAQIGAKLIPLEEVFARADIITVHTPLNQDTRGLVDSSAFGLMKEGVIIINCARGGIVDEEALLEALNSGKVAAAALDVYTVSPPGNSVLVMHPKVIATPHVGASTDEAQQNVAVSIAEQIVDYLENGVIRNAVNAPRIDPGQSVRIRPYLDLSRRLAQFAGQLAPSGVAEMEIEYRGEISGWDLKPITNASLVGFLTIFEEAAVNYVNAPLIAAERGLRVLETTTSEGAEHGSSIVIRIRSVDNECLSVEGALIRRAGYEPRIIGIDRFVTEAVPAGPMLIVTNQDIPGMIAGMSGVLSRGRINIAQMNLSRDHPGGRAVSIINVDTPADDEILDTIRAIHGIISVRQVTLDQ